MRYFLLNLMILLVIGCSGTTPSVTTQREDAIAKDAIAKDTIAKDTIAKDAIAKDTIAKDTIAKDTIAKDTIAKDAIAKDAIAKDTIAKDTIAKDAKDAINNLFKEFKSNSENKQKVEEAYSNLEDISKICIEKDLHTPICANSFYNKGLIEEEIKKDYKKAVTSYEKSLKFGLYDKDDGKTHKKIADIYYLRLNNVGDALKSLKKLYNLDEKFKLEDSELNYYIGMLYIENKEFKSSKEYIFKAKNLGNRNAENLWYQYKIYTY